MAFNVNDLVIFVYPPPGAAYQLHLHGGCSVGGVLHKNVAVGQTAGCGQTFGNQRQIEWAPHDRRTRQCVCPSQARCWLATVTLTSRVCIDVACSGMNHAQPGSGRHFRMPR